MKFTFSILLISLAGAVCAAPTDNAGRSAPLVAGNVHQKLAERSAPLVAGDVHQKLAERSAPLVAGDVHQKLEQD
ncbi:hypothetical protein CONPUDRAFT_155635 [Coniophora puteana RWD-64-598 SS2]|uniref:Uncharacterized protein n=1 Tax=Coniophora puteana (strain RWD-64-598) TaxID=741705 RepID=A0A5M3MIX8_CONPW|nr:uncharacterized protein CONPUDRAFT_155635 [Coniophora puteana RWD-64-598 SS2]EIW78937.1 hypothetical protein CONPUDRAFT_155635 [Coniophora puteana RWD-64-598 SS2]